MALYRNTKTGVVFLGNGFLENGPDMVPYTPKEVQKAEPPKDPDEPYKVTDDGLDAMDKDALEVYAKVQYGVDLDKRYGLGKLREQVRALMENA